MKADKLQDQVRKKIHNEVDFLVDNSILFMTVRPSFSEKILEKR